MGELGMTRCGPLGRARRGPRMAARRWVAGAALGAVGLFLTGVLPALGQEKPLRIGVLALGPRKVPSVRCGAQGPQQTTGEPQVEAVPADARGLRDELEKMGYVEDRPETKGKAGRRFVLTIGQGNLEAVKRYAQQFAQERVDIIFAMTTLPVRTAQEVTRTNPIPIIFTAVSDPVGDGFAISLARPGGWITGVSTQLIQGSGKRVEIFKEMMPRARRLLTISKADFEVAQRSLAEMRPAAAGLGIALLEKHASSRAEIEGILSGVRREALDGIIFPVDAVLVANADLVLEASLKERVPAFGIVDFLAEWGALAAYGPSPYQSGRRAAYYVDKIARGAKPGDLPVEPLDPTFVVNLKAAACLGVSVPPAVLHQADRVIR